MASDDCVCGYVYAAIWPFAICYCTENKMARWWSRLRTLACLVWPTVAHRTFHKTRISFVCAYDLTLHPAYPHIDDLPLRQLIACVDWTRVDRSTRSLLPRGSLLTEIRCLELWSGVVGDL